MDAFANPNLSSEFSSYETKNGFSPYINNQGTVVAIAGEDFAVIASDTRLSTGGFAIHTRDQAKIFKLSDQTVLGCTGCWCDVLSLRRYIDIRMKMYKHEHNKVMSTGAISQLLSSMMYFRRFFPYYVFTLLAGLDNNGKGCIYSFDSVGHKEFHRYIAVGSSCQLLQPMLDNQIGRKNIEDHTEPPRLTVEETVMIAKDIFISAAERDIYTGDGILMNVITKDGVSEKYFSLRND